MANIEITNNDTGSVELHDGEFIDDSLTFGTAGTVKKGTILARDSLSKRLVPYAKGGSTNENGVPKAVLTYDVTATGAGNVPVRALIKGTVNARRLVIHADGDDSNIDAPVLDQLRSYAIVAAPASQLGIYDNPEGESDS